MTAFVARQARVANPLMPLRLFRSRNVAGREPRAGASSSPGCSACSSSARCTCSGCSATTPLEVGLAFLPSTIVMGALSMGFSGRITMRFGTKRTLIPSLLLIGAGMLLFARTPVAGPTSST